MFFIACATAYFPQRRNAPKVGFVLQGDKNKYSSWSQYSAWLPDNQVSESKIAGLLKNLVTDQGSLTQALMSIDKLSFEVRVLDEEIACPYPHEQEKLGRDIDRKAWIREVELCLFANPVVFARSIIPLSLVNQGSKGLAGLGNTPLGQVLFTDGNIRVSKRDFLFFQCDQTKLVARRTPYDYQDNTILVSEFFLPAITHLLK